MVVPRHNSWRASAWSTSSNGPCAAVARVRESGGPYDHQRIVADDAKEYFFHRDGLDSSLNFDRLVGGEKVTFEIESSPKGPRATRVTAA